MNDEEERYKESENAEFKLSIILIVLGMLIATLYYFF